MLVKLTAVVGAKKASIFEQEDRKSFEVVGGVGGDEHVMLEAKLSGDTANNSKLPN